MLENGQLLDLAEGLVALLSCRQVAAISVAVVTLVPSMTDAGTAGFAAGPAERHPAPEEKTGNLHIAQATAKLAAEWLHLMRPLLEFAWS
jgi:hypothetical protein